MVIIFTKKVFTSGKTTQLIIPKDIVEAYNIISGQLFRITLETIEESE